MTYFHKFRGQSQQLPPTPPLKNILFVWFGVFLAAMILGLGAYISGYPLVMGSFGASCFIIFILPNSPFSQPRNVIGGHVVSTFVGLLCFHVLGAEWWSMALALATAITLMQILNVPHPPAASNPFIVFLAAAPWDFLLMPTLLGAILLVIIALFYNNLATDRHYPTYWF